MAIEKQQIKLTHEQFGLLYQLVKTIMELYPPEWDGEVSLYEHLNERLYEWKLALVKENNSYSISFTKAEAYDLYFFVKGINDPLPDYTAIIIDRVIRTLDQKFGLERVRVTKLIGSG